MSWENYGKFTWHIDHIIPVAVFNFSSFKDLDFKRCWALSNLQPLEAKKNHSKGCRVSKPFQPSLILREAGSGK
jgi:5-methylcytosine-specific restriction endonuclease McrA